MFGYNKRGETMIEMRQYQRGLLRSVETALAPERARVMMQLPTGGGKTIIAAHLLSRYLRGARKAVWLTHRTELAAQTGRMLADAAGVDAWHVQRPSQAPMPARQRGVVIIMAQTAGRRARNADVWSKYDQDDLLIIDEAHHAAADGYERAMERWSGRVLGMTATPWRLSLKEGFGHLFDNLACGPQTSELQRGGFLCEARVVAPTPDRLIRGGEPGLSGDYTEGGIERANADSPDVMTAGALEFWQERARGRQTIIYAVSVKHAHNLTTMFRNAGVAADLMLGNTPADMRESTIRSFRNGNLTVLVNVAVATEGFDLPDASCVIIARPTKSLALYLQMLGRGMRPKDGGGDCVILDLAGNSLEHGLPNERREWSLAPRGELSSGDAPAVRCDRCGELSPAASHNCQRCGEPFGEDCRRCGKWRAWKRWEIKCAHADGHDAVCDLCHADAHIQARLPVTDEMKELSELRETEDGPLDGDNRRGEESAELDGKLASLFREILEDERRRALSDRESDMRDLSALIAQSENDLKDDAVLDKRFEEYIAALPEDTSPATTPQKYRMYVEWENRLQKENQDRKDELAKLAASSMDVAEITERAQDRIMKIWNGVEIPPPSDSVAPPSPEWTPLVGLVGDNANIKRLKLPSGKEIPVQSWHMALSETAEWIVASGKISEENLPLFLPRGGASCLINNAPYHPDGRRFKEVKRLSNGMFIFTGMNMQTMIGSCVALLRMFGEDPSKFYAEIERR